MKDNPPKLFHRFFRWYCHPELLNYIEGDLMELYAERKVRSGERKADLRFIMDVLLLFRPGIIRGRTKNYTINHSDMFKHYFTVGWRNLVKNKGYSLINIGGLAIGMAVAILIGLWVYDEVAFNTGHKNYDRIAQVRRVSTDPHTGITRSGEALQFPLGTALKDNYDQYFEHTLMGFWIGQFTLSSEDKKLSSTGEFIDGGAPDMLSLKMLKGTYASLNDPHSIILSKSTADNLFGSDDPINKNIKIDNRMDVIVTGVYEDLPENATFGPVKFFSTWDLWVLSNDWVRAAEHDWGNSSFNVYVQLKPGVTWEAAQAGLENFYRDYAPKEDAEEYKKFKPELFLYHMDQWHLYSEFENGYPSGGRITFVWLFGIVGVFVLLLACINFMNLSTARSEKRAKEVGVRKAIGSVRRLLVYQFVSESFLIVLLAFSIALLIVSLGLSLFNEVAAKHMSLPFSQPVFWLISFAFIAITGLLASLYPAFYLSSFQPVRVLRGTFRLGRFASLPRKVLVVLQFTVSVVLIIGTVVVYQQIQFARNRPVGYDRAGLVSVPMNDPNYRGKFDVLKNELLNTGAVTDVAASSSPLTAVWNNNGGYNWSGKDPELASDFAATYVSHDFGKLVGWEFTAGRDFSKLLKSDSASLVITETAAEYLGLKNPIGEIIKQNGNDRTWQIIGVINDMVMSSPYEPEKRAFFFLDHRDNSGAYLHIRLKPTESASAALPKIEKVFSKIVPSASFDYKLVDEQFASKFQQEERIGKLASLFAVLAIFISCLGLFGLASFVAEQRTKEIGVRKVLGASVFNLWRMLSKDFVLLVIISVFIAIPVAFYFMNNWLQDYQYRIKISWWIFAVSGISALLITLLTVSFQSVRAAMSNPVNSLKSE